MLFNFSQDGGSNPGPIAYEAIALPAELSWQQILITYIFYKKSKIFARTFSRHILFIPFLPSGILLRPSRVYQCLHSQSRWIITVLLQKIRLGYTVGALIKFIQPTLGVVQIIFQ